MAGRGEAFPPGERGSKLGGLQGRLKPFLRVQPLFPFKQMRLAFQTLSLAFFRAPVPVGLFCVGRKGVGLQVGRISFSSSLMGVHPVRLSARRAVALGPWGAAGREACGGKEGAEVSSLQM